MGSSGYTVPYAWTSQFMSSMLSASSTSPFIPLLASHTQAVAALQAVGAEVLAGGKAYGLSELGARGCSRGGSLCSRRSHGHSAGADRDICASDARCGV